MHGIERPEIVHRTGDDMQDLDNMILEVERVSEAGKMGMMFSLEVAG